MYHAVSDVVLQQEAHVLLILMTFQESIVRRISMNVSLSRVRTWEHVRTLRTSSAVSVVNLLLVPCVRLLYVR